MFEQAVEMLSDLGGVFSLPGHFDETYIHTDGTATNLLFVIPNQTVPLSFKADPLSVPGPVTVQNKGELDSAVQQLKNQVDSLSNSQQMDMLRLQSLSNKRNEAFNVMTDFIKKMQDSRSNIIGNIR